MLQVYHYLPQTSTYENPYENPVPHRCAGFGDEPLSAGHYMTVNKVVQNDNVRKT